ncbi:MAG: hypothetical protein KDJ46_02980 [Rhodobiaceae bacterium]|nr:hypothetical protein [Rhodobiaceae bacterium]
MTMPTKGQTKFDQLEIVEFARKYLLEIITIQNEQFRRLLGNEYDIPVDLVEAFEDAANTYMDLSTIVELSAVIRERHQKCMNINPQAD